MLFRSEFANSGQMDDQAGVHISLSRPEPAEHINVFLPLGAAAKLLLELQHSLAHAYAEAPADQRSSVEGLAAHEDSMARGMAALGHPGGNTGTLEFLTARAR